MALPAEEKAWRKEAKEIYENRIPGDLKERFELLLQGWGKGSADRARQLLTMKYQIGGLDEALAYANQLEEGRKKELQKQALEMKKAQEKEDILQGKMFNPSAYTFILNQALQRLEGKEHSQSRPHLGLRFELRKEGFLLAFTPVMNSSPTGWKITRIDAEFRPYVSFPEVTALALKARLTSEGGIDCSRWLKDMDKTAQLVTLLQSALNTLATSPEKLFEGSCHCCLCGKGLVDEISKARGIGPECGRHVNSFIPLTGAA